MLFSHPFIELISFDKSHIIFNKQQNKQENEQENKFYKNEQNIQQNKQYYLQQYVLNYEQKNEQQKNIQQNIQNYIQQNEQNKQTNVKNNEQENIKINEDIKINEQNIMKSMNILYNYSYKRERDINKLLIYVDNITIYRINKSFNNVKFMIDSDIKTYNAICNIGKVIKEYLEENNINNTIINQKFIISKYNKIILRIGKSSNIYIHPSKKSKNDVIKYNGTNKFLEQNIIEQYPYLNKTSKTSNVYIKGQIIFFPVIYRCKVKNEENINIHLYIKECELKYNNSNIESILDTNVLNTNYIPKKNILVEL